MTKRKQKRYTEEQEILDAIDKARNLAAQCLAEAIECDKAVEVCQKQIAKFEDDLNNFTEDGEECQRIRLDIQALHFRANFQKDNAKRLSNRRNRIEQVKLHKLKNALAAFRTELLSITEDRGVVVE